MKAYDERVPVHNAQRDEARAEVNRPNEGIDTSLTESVSGSRDTAVSQKEAGVRPSPLYDTMGSMVSDKSAQT